MPPPVQRACAQVERSLPALEAKAAALEAAAEAVEVEGGEDVAAAALALMQRLAERRAELRAVLCRPQHVLPFLQPGGRERVLHCVVWAVRPTTLSGPWEGEGGASYCPGRCVACLTTHHASAWFTAPQRSTTTATTERPPLP